MGSFFLERERAYIGTSCGNPAYCFNVIHVLWFPGHVVVSSTMVEIFSQLLIQSLNSCQMNPVFRFQSVEYRCELPYSENKPIAVSLIEEAYPAVKVGKLLRNTHVLMRSLCSSVVHLKA